MFFAFCVWFGRFGLRLMLLPLIDMADVIAYVHCGWCFCHVADVRPLGWFYFSLSSGMLHTTIQNFSIVGREDQNLIRAIGEAIYIRVNNPSLNRNIGKYHLPHIWDEVLNNIPKNVQMSPGTSQPVAWKALQLSICQDNLLWVRSLQWTVQPQCQQSSIWSPQPEQLTSSQQCSSQLWQPSPLEGHQIVPWQCCPLDLASRMGS